MLQQARKNKRGVSEIIGYILLIAITVVISVFVYVWLKTYVPQQSLTCPDGVSISITNHSYDCVNKIFNFTLSNDGTFSIAGYYIHMANDSSQQIAAIDLTPDYIGPFSNRAGNAIIFGNNVKVPGSSISMNDNGYQLNSLQGTIRKLEIIPIRYVESSGRLRIVSCTNAGITIPISDC